MIVALAKTTMQPEAVTESSTVGVSSMRCTSCDGMGSRPNLNSGEYPCGDCQATGRISSDHYEEKLREASAKVGMVYFIRDDVHGRIKIGTSLNPLGRLRELQTGNGVRLRLMSISPGGRSAEQSYHKTFSDRRLVGEWFDDSDRWISRILLLPVSSESVFWPDEIDP